MGIGLIAVLGSSLAAGAGLAQAPTPPGPEPSGTVFFPGVLVRPDGRPAHLNEAAHPSSGKPAAAPGSAVPEEGTASPARDRRPPRRSRKASEDRPRR